MKSTYIVCHVIRHITQRVTLHYMQSDVLGMIRNILYYQEKLKNEKQ